MAISFANNGKIPQCSPKITSTWYKPPITNPDSQPLDNNNHWITLASPLDSQMIVGPVMYRVIAEVTAITISGVKIICKYPGNQLLTHFANLATYHLKLLMSDVLKHLQRLQSELGHP